MEGGRLRNCVMMGMLIMLGTMTSQSDASFQQCLVRCLRTCIFETTCTIKCGINCAISDPPSIDSVAPNRDINNLCNLGCLATALTHKNPGLAESKQSGAYEAMAEALVLGCSTTCGKKE